MSELKITPRICGGPRWSTSASRRLAQVERNLESTDRQYELVDRAAQLGWPRQRGAGDRRRPRRQRRQRPPAGRGSPS